jgi:NAD(P)-dependent dehydrogenase (short-subunit alcohol dehydrogenase family)
MSDIRWDDPNFTTGYEPILAYGQSKTANILFAVELDRRWSDQGIHGYAVHPGIVLGTNLQMAPDSADVRARNFAMGLIDEDGNPIIDPEREKKTPQQGASTAVFAATSPLLADIGGVYLRNNDISTLDENPQPIVFGTTEVVATDVVPYAIDPDSAVRLWDLSEELIKR